MGDIVGIVLAAGASERMGEPKLVLPFGESTILNSTIAAVTASSLDRVIVVTGAYADVVEPSIIDGRIDIVRNADYRRGNMSSFLTGADAAPEADAFVLTAGDLPTLATSDVDALVACWEPDQPWAVVTEYHDRIAYPFLLSRGAVDETHHTAGPKALWRALVEPGDARVLRISSESDAPVDINTPEDYGRLSKA